MMTSHSIEVLERTWVRPLPTVQVGHHGVGGGEGGSGGREGGGASGGEGGCVGGVGGLAGDGGGAGGVGGPAFRHVAVQTLPSGQGASAQPPRTPPS